MKNITPAEARTLAMDVLHRREQDRLSAASDCSVALSVRDELRTVFAAYRRLIEQGWQEPNPYTDKGYDLLILEPGSTGVHFGTCDGTEFGYWIHDGDVCPSRPLLVRRLRKLT